MQPFTIPLPPTVEMLSLYDSGSGPYVAVPKGSVSMLEHYKKALAALREKGGFDNFNTIRSELTESLHAQEHPFRYIVVAQFNHTVLYNVQRGDFISTPIDMELVIIKARRDAYVLAAMLEDTQPVDTEVECALLK